MTRARSFKALIAMLCAVTLVAAACSSDGGGANSASDVGVTETTIKIGVGVSDLDGLRASGFSLPAALTTGNLSKRITSYFDDWNAAGGINGRTIEPVVLTWDPVNPTTQDQMCAEATVDNEIFLMVVASGLNIRTVQCIVDGGVPLMFGEVPTQAALDTGIMISMGPPVEVVSEAGTKAAIEDGSLPSGASVGILSGNGPEGIAGSGAAEAILKSEGYTVTKVQVNSVQGDTGVINQESAASINTFKAAGVTHVLQLMPFTQVTGFWNGIPGSGISVVMLDVASSNCTPFGASRTPANAAGSPCITAYGDGVTSSGQLRPETDFEKECRAHFDKISAGDYPTPSAPGVPSGQVIETVDGETLSSDFPFYDCTLTAALKRGLEAAGKNPTRSSFMEAMLGLGSVDMALASDGKGTLNPDKPYMADYLHPVTLKVVPATTPRNANKTFDGCPAPASCWIPTSNEWFKID